MADVKETATVQDAATDTAVTDKPVVDPGKQTDDKTPRTTIAAGSEADADKPVTIQAILIAPPSGTDSRSTINWNRGLNKPRK